MTNGLEPLWRRRNLVLAIALIVTMASYSFSALRPNLYKAEAVFEAQERPSDFIADFLALPDEDFLVLVFDELKLEKNPEFSNKVPRDKSVVGRLAPRFFRFWDPLFGGETDRERGLRILAERVRTTPDPAARGLRVEVVAESSGTAGDVLARLYQHYRTSLAEKYVFVSREEEKIRREGEKEACRKAFLSHLESKKFDDCLEKSHKDKDSGKNVVVTRLFVPSWKESFRPPLTPFLSWGIVCGIVLGGGAAFLADHWYRRQS